MKKAKIIICIAIILTVIMAFEKWEQEQIERCVSARHDRTYCEVKLG